LLSSPQVSTTKKKSGEQDAHTIAMIPANLQELESWPMCIYWNLLVAGVAILFMYAIAVGEARGIVPIAARY